MWIIKNVWTRTSIRAFVVLALVGGLSLNASARGYVAGVTPNGSGGFKLKFSPSGSSSATLNNTSTGVGVTAAVALPLSPASLLQTVAVGAVGGVATGGAMGAAIGALGALAIAAIPVLVDMMNKAKLRVKPDGGLETEDPRICTVAPCYEWEPFAGMNGTPQPWTYSPENACALSVGRSWSGTIIASASWGSGQCTFLREAGTMIATWVPPVRSIAAQSPGYVDIVLADAVAKLTANAPTAAEVQALVDLNFPPEVSLPVMSGPARQFMGNTVEMFSPNERKLIEEWKNMDYSTPGEVKVQTEKKTTVTSDAKTTTTVTVNPDGTTSTATTTQPAATRTETTFDTDEPAKEDPCKAFPARVGCTDIDVPEGEIPRSSKTITFQEENVFGSGSCPANMTATVATLGKTVTVWDWSKTCEKSLPLRAMVLLLSSFAAFLIVMPGSTRT